MSDVGLEVVEDEAALDNGQPVIRLTGLWLLPPGTIYMIEALDTSIDVKAEGAWPTGERRPVETRVTSKGVEMVLDRGVAEARELVPGALVRVTIPAIAVSTVLPWPALGKTHEVHVPDPAPAEPASPAATELDRHLSERLREGELRLEQQLQTSEKALKADLTKLSLLVRGGGPGRALDGLDDPASILEDADLLEAVDRMVPAANAPALAVRQADSGLASTLSPVQPQQPVATTANAARDLATRPDQGRETSLVVAQPASRQTSAIAPFLAGFAIASAMTAIVWAFGPAAAPPRTATVAVTAPAAPPQSLEDLFSTGPVSPSGQAAGAVAEGDRLALADRLLAEGDEQANRNEAKFWLRQELASIVAQPRTRWALTQIGSLFADPRTGTPDYAKARSVWELSAGQGDPVAMCFLGSLHEHGLGVPADRNRALGYFQRAKALGGCKDIDQTIARLKE